MRNLASKVTLFDLLCYSLYSFQSFPRRIYLGAVYEGYLAIWGWKYFLILSTKLQVLICCRSTVYLTHEVKFSGMNACTVFIRRHIQVIYNRIIFFSFFLHHFYLIRLIEAYLHFFDLHLSTSVAKPSWFQ